MARKRWHVYFARDRRGRITTGVTNEIDKVAAVYAEPRRDRSDALRAASHLRRLRRANKMRIIREAAGTKRARETLPGKLYQVRNEGFVCANCGARVEPTVHDTPRNHCPRCLYGLHVDIHPGDRKNPCRGLLVPIGVETSGRKGYSILYECSRCRERKRAKAALKSAVQPDDFDKIIELSRRALKKADLLF